MVAVGTTLPVISDLGAVSSKVDRSYLKEKELCALIVRKGWRMESVITLEYGLMEPVKRTAHLSAGRKRKSYGPPYRDSNTLSNNSGCRFVPDGYQGLLNRQA